MQLIRAFASYMLILNFNYNLVCLYFNTNTEFKEYDSTKVTHHFRLVYTLYTHTIHTLCTHYRHTLTHTHIHSHVYNFVYIGKLKWNHLLVKVNTTSEYTQWYIHTYIYIYITVYNMKCIIYNVRCRVNYSVYTV